MPPHQTQLLLADTECAMAPQPFAVFRCDGALQLRDIHGQFVDWLGCDSKELLGAGWQSFLNEPSQDTLMRLDADKRACRSGRYDLPFLSREGQRLYVSVQTYAVHQANNIVIAGTIGLLAWESPRTFIALRGVVRCALPYLVACCSHVLS